MTSIKYIFFKIILMIDTSSSSVGIDVGIIIVTEQQTVELSIEDIVYDITS
jgi:hypothetical protein